MWGSEIEEHISKFPFTKRHFKGVCSFDQAHNLLNHPWDFCVLNVKESTHIGQHWFFFIQTDSTFNIIDSIGANSAFIRKHFSFTKTIQFNLLPIQPRKSNKCGLYAAFFAITRISNPDLSLKQYLSAFFTSNLDQNEQTVIQFFRDV